MAKKLVLDADMPQALRTELMARGRAADNLRHLGLGENLKDPLMLRRLRRKFESSEIVLVTTDDRMPRMHGDVLREVGFALATLDGRWNYWGHPDQDAYRRDVVHRFAHAMAEQPAGLLIRYTPVSSRAWTPSKRTR